MFWDLFSIISEQGFGSDDVVKKMGFNSTWNTTLGDAITNVIGGSRFANVIGSDAKIVFDWEEMLMKGLFSNMPSIAQFGHGKLGAALFGIGGDTSMVFGNKTSFTYFTDKADCEYSVHKIDVNWSVPVNCGVAGLPYPVIAALLGVIVMTVMTLCLKYIWKFSSSNRWTVNTNSDNPTLEKASTNTTAMDWAMILYPALETRWLALVKCLHTAGYSASQLYFELFNDSKTVLTTQIIDIENKLQLAKSKIQALTFALTNSTTLMVARANTFSILEKRLTLMPIEIHALGENVEKYELSKTKLCDEFFRKTLEVFSAKKGKP